MNFLQKIKIQKYTINFWSGFCLQKVLSHPKDGTSGFMVLLLDSVQEERKKYSRDLKIDKIINNFDYQNFDDVLQNLHNDYVIIYQSNGDNDTLIQILKEKFSRELFTNWADYCE
jgi:hypothetical protein